MQSCLPQDHPLKPVFRLSFLYGTWYSRLTPTLEGGLLFSEVTFIFIIGYLPVSGPLDFCLVIQVLFGLCMILKACACRLDFGLSSHSNDATPQIIKGQKSLSPSAPGQKQVHSISAVAVAVGLYAMIAAKLVKLPQCNHFSV